MKKVVEIIFGLLILVALFYVGIVSQAWGWGLYRATITVIKGGIVILVALIGIILILLGISELKS